MIMAADTLSRGAATSAREHADRAATSAADQWAAAGISEAGILEAGLEAAAAGTKVAYGPEAQLTRRAAK
jgi:hypothetical protein